MQIEVRKSEAKVEREYPYVGVFDEDGQELKVLFLSDDTGIVVSDTAEERITGEFDDDWQEEDFTPIAKVKKLIIETE